MPGRSGSTLNKRQKEQLRQQKQREKAERKSLRRQEKQQGTVDDMQELRAHAEAQAALFEIDSHAPTSAQMSERDNDKNSF